MNTLHDKVAVITGAASGIGCAIACALAGRGAHIVAVDRDNDVIGALADKLSPASVLVQPADVSDPQAFEDIRSAALRRFDINLMSVVRSNAAFLPLLLEQGSGHELRCRVEDWDAYIDYQISRER
jgi:NAD(P)-dependent dehydrogenase (short-subunit alcohol dehydrogenase family)